MVYVQAVLIQALLVKMVTICFLIHLTSCDILWSSVKINSALNFNIFFKGIIQSEIKAEQINTLWEMLIYWTIMKYCHISNNIFDDRFMEYF